MIVPVLGHSLMISRSLKDGALSVKKSLNSLEVIDLLRFSLVDLSLLSRFQSNRRNKNKGETNSNKKGAHSSYLLVILAKSQTEISKSSKPLSMPPILTRPMEPLNLI